MPASTYHPSVKTPVKLAIASVVLGAILAPESVFFGLGLASRFTFDFGQGKSVLGALPQNSTVRVQPATQPLLPIAGVVIGALFYFIAVKLTLRFFQIEQRDKAAVVAAIAALLSMIPFVVGGFVRIPLGMLALGAAAALCGIGAAVLTGTSK